MTESKTASSLQLSNVHQGNFFVLLLKMFFFAFLLLLLFFKFSVYLVKLLFKLEK